MAAIFCNNKKYGEHFLLPSIFILVLVKKNTRHTKSKLKISLKIDTLNIFPLSDKVFGIAQCALNEQVNYARAQVPRYLR